MYRVTELCHGQQLQGLLAPGQCRRRCVVMLRPAGRDASLTALPGLLACVAGKFKLKPPPEGQRR